jgi:hypothetical protein
MIFSLAQAARFSADQSRQASELAAAMPNSRTVAAFGRHQNYQRTPARSGLFGVLVSNGVPQGRWF